MTVSTAARKQQFSLDGVTSVFTFTFRALVSQPTAICCVATVGGVDTTLTYASQYTVSINANGVGGTVTLISPDSVGSGTLTVYRSTTNTQISDYSDYNQFPADTLENDLDIRCLVEQELSEAQDRTVKLAISSSGSVSSTLPVPSANQVLGWNAAANAIVNITPNASAYISKAGQSDAEAMTDDSLYMTPKQVGYSKAVVAVPSADHGSSGTKITLQANEAQTFGDICFINSSGKAQLAKADAAATSGALVMCCDATIAANGSGNYLLIGIARDASWSWTVGGLVFLSTTGVTQGTLTQSLPTAVNSVTQVIGVATNAGRIFFNPSLVQVVHS